MNEESRKALDTYYAKAGSWDDDRIKATRSSQQLAWWVAGATAALAILQAIALVLLTPLKTVELYTLMVDRTTGYVQALKPLDQAKVEPDAALTQAFLAQYVIAREGFDLAVLSTNYRKVALFSSDRARSDYLQLMQGSNPAGPIATYPRTTLIDVRVKSVSPIGRDTVLVRFDTVRLDSGSQPSPQTPWVAVIRYRYSTQPMRLEDRLVNPLGFQVFSYRKDAEAPPRSASEIATVPAQQPQSSPVLETQQAIPPRAAR